MSDHVTDQIGTLVSRLAQTLNRKFSEIVLLLFNHKNAGSFGALAGFAIAVIFTCKFLRAPPGRPRRNRPKRRVPQPAGGGEENGAGTRSQDCSLESNLKNLDVLESPVELTLGQIVRRKLNGGRKMTCQLLGVILEERSPEELQKQATVRSSVLEVVLEISKSCDIYLMERVLDDESEERVLSALEGAGLFLTSGLTKEKVLFCSTDLGRSSFVRQLEPDWHVDSNIEVVSQLSVCFLLELIYSTILFLVSTLLTLFVQGLPSYQRFIRCQLHISELELEQIGPNVFSSVSLEKYFASL